MAEPVILSANEREARCQHYLTVTRPMIYVKSAERLRKKRQGIRRKRGLGHE